MSDRRLQHRPRVVGGRQNVTALPEPFLAEHDLVTAFEEGWRLLYEDVSLRVAHRLSATLADVRHLDSEIARDLDRLQRRLVLHRSAGAPSRAQIRMARQFAARRRDLLLARADRPRPCGVRR